MEISEGNKYDGQLQHRHIAAFSNIRLEIEERIYWTTYFSQEPNLTHGKALASSLY